MMAQLALYASNAASQQILNAMRFNDTEQVFSLIFIIISTILTCPFLWKHFMNNFLIKTVNKVNVLKLKTDVLKIKSDLHTDCVDM